MEEYMEAWNDTEEIKERMDLCRERLSLISSEETVPEEYRAFFKAQAKKLLRIFDYGEEAVDGSFYGLPQEECQRRFNELYDDCSSLFGHSLCLQHFRECVTLCQGDCFRPPFSKGGALRVAAPAAQAIRRFFC